MDYPERITLATRKSPLALAQSKLVKAKLATAFPEIQIDIVTMNTSGDTNTTMPLADIGGKGLFSKELEESLLLRKVDIAVHSMKDMETHLRPGLVIAAVLEREDPRDVFLARQEVTIMSLPRDAAFGTSSVRRTAQLKAMRPDINIIPFRGNVATRLEKLESGMADATMLAFAALKRLEITEKATQILDTRDFIPAAGQGIIAIECLERNEKIRAMLQVINHEPTWIASHAERAMLGKLDGSCRTPIAGYAVCKRGFVQLEGLVASRDGSFCVKTLQAGSASDAEKIGTEVADYLLAHGGRECLKP